MRKLLVLAALPLLGCAADAESPSLRPNWLPNQEFFLESSYQAINARTERGDMAHDVAADNLLPTMDLDDQWTLPVYWRYQVVKQGYAPAEGDDLYEYAEKGGTFSSLTVIKAALDPTLNLGSELVEADPKIYMVIREDRLRMAGLVVFNTIDGQRIEEAITVDDEEMGRAFNRLSQTSLATIPHFIPPFPIRPEDGDMVLEDGSMVSFANASDASVDVVYDNSIDDSLIAETWEDGQPWATYSFADNVESRLLDADEVLMLRDGEEAFDDHEDPEDFDYIEALRSPVNLSDSLKVTADMVGTATHSAREGYRPWAGNWWPQASQELVFGHTGENKTLSQLRKAEFVEPGTRIQNIGDDLRDLRKDGQGESEEYNTKVEEYRQAQTDLVTELRDFYNAVRAAVDGGQIRIADGRISADEGWNGEEGDDAYPAFDFALDELSPMDKFALAQQRNGHFHGTNPWYAPAWELLNHWSPAGSSWFGHCNGWSAAAILTNEPREDVMVQMGDIEVAFSPADQKGLLSESFYSQHSQFWGQRNNGGEDDDPSDLSPKATLQLLQTFVRDRQVPLVFDTDPGDAVWNFPAWRYELTLIEEQAPAGQQAFPVNVNTAGIEQLTTVNGIAEWRAERIVAYREANGPFQTVDDLIKVRGIGRGTLNRMLEQITVSGGIDSEGKYVGEIVLTYTSDGVDPEHIDTDPNEPESGTDRWNFELTTDAHGVITDSQWENDEADHPDFAWSPYSNPTRSGRSENGYLPWRDLREYLPDAQRQ